MKTKITFLISSLGILLVGTACINKTVPSGVTENDETARLEVKAIEESKVPQADAVELVPVATEPAEIIASTPAIKVSDILGTVAKVTNACTLLDVDVEKVVQTSAQVLSGIPYSHANKTDCSGMFHKLVDKVRMACPNAVLPEIETSRTTRGIAHWYFNNGNFTIVRNPQEMGKHIRPGTVMFYGYGNREYDFATLSIADLVKQGTGIKHVSVVTEVTVENGEVVAYKMFHGRRPGKPSAITGSELRPRRQELPPFGNWKDPLLAVADIVGLQSL